MRCSDFIIAYITENLYIWCSTKRWRLFCVVGANNYHHVMKSEHRIGSHMPMVLNIPDKKTRFHALCQYNKSLK